MAGDDTYQEYERKCREQREKNAGYLDEFEDWLIASKLKDKTIDRHLGNVEFYLNDFLLYSDALSMEEGVVRIDEFFSDFFVRKCMWASPTQTRQNAASLKKFYKCMQEKGRISADELAHLMTTVKENMNRWLAAADDYAYDDGDIYSPGGLFGTPDSTDFLSDDPGDVLGNMEDMFLNSLLGSLGPHEMAQLLTEALVAGQGDGGPYDLTSMSHSEAVASFALMYLYLTAQDARDTGTAKGVHIPTWRASVTIADEDLATLRGKGFVGPTEDGKVCVSEEGMVHAERLFEEMGLERLL